MSGSSDEALRRQTFIWVMGLISSGMGRCPGCQQSREIFYRRRPIGVAKERCLGCWRAER